MGVPSFLFRSASWRRVLARRRMEERRRQKTSCNLEMEAEELSGRELTIDSIMSKVRDIKNKFKNEDLTDELSLNKVSADTTDNSGTANQIMMMANNPEDWLNFLLKLEKNSVPLNDAVLNKLIGRYSQAIETLPPDKYGQNESFARIQVRFAELKAMQEPDDARDYFQMARANCKKCAFVHISFAQFELSQAVESGAVLLEMLEIAICNLNLQKKQLLSEEEKKGLSVLKFLRHLQCLLLKNHSPVQLDIYKSKDMGCDSRGQATKARFLYGENIPPQDAEISHRNPLKQTNKTKQSCPFGRVPVNLLNSPDCHVKTDGSAVPTFTKSCGHLRTPSAVPCQLSDYLRQPRQLLQHKVCEFRMGLDMHLPGGLCVAGGVPGYTARGSDRQTPELTGGGGSLWRGAGQAFFLIEDLTGSCFEPLPQGLLLHELPDRRSCLAAGHQWRGYTVSAHTFLLTFCCLLMAEEAAVFAKYLAHGLPAGSPLCLVFLLNVLLLGLWNFLLLCTVIYFHQYTHKVVGAAVGTFAWYLTYGSWYHQPWSPGSPGHGLFPRPPLQPQA